MSASSSIAAAKRRRGGAMPPPPVTSSASRAGSMTPQQKALLMQQHHMMAQRATQGPPPNFPQVQQQQQHKQPPVHSSPALSHTPTPQVDHNFQVVDGPNGLSVPVGSDGKPVHPGVLIMNHERRILHLEHTVKNRSNLPPGFDSDNAINIVVEEGESAPWEQDIGMLSLRMDELTRKVNDGFSSFHSSNHSNIRSQEVSSSSVSSEEINELRNKINKLERELDETKSLLNKVQTFSMETNTTLLRYSNMFEENMNEKGKLEQTLRDNLDNDTTPLNNWLSDASLTFKNDELEPLETVELEESLDNEQPTFSEEHQSE